MVARDQRGEVAGPAIPHRELVVHHLLVVVGVRLLVHILANVAQPVLQLRALEVLHLHLVLDVLDAAHQHHNHGRIDQQHRHIDEYEPDPQSVVLLLDEQLQGSRAGDNQIRVRLCADWEGEGSVIHDEMVALRVEPPESLESVGVGGVGSADEGEAV